MNVADSVPPSVRVIGEIATEIGVTGWTVAVDTAIAVGNRLETAAIVADMARVARFSACGTAATVVMLASVVIVHIVPAGSVAVATVNVTAAAA